MVPTVAIRRSRAWRAARSRDRWLDARDGQCAQQGAEQEAEQLPAVEVAVLDPVQARTVHEPQPAADCGATRGRHLARRWGDAFEDPRGGAIADLVYELAHP